MCRQEQHLITSIMLGDLVAHGGHQFVYGWYLRHTIGAEILLWLMGRTEELDCQRGVSPHFSFRASKAPHAHHLSLLHPASLFCHHLSAVTESSGIWRRERECQLALTSLTNLFFPSQKPRITCSWFFSVTMLGTPDLFSPLQFKCGNGSVCITIVPALHDGVHKTAVKAVYIPHTRERYKERGRAREDVTFTLKRFCLHCRNGGRP